jgi:competence protein ComGC
MKRDVIVIANFKRAFSLMEFLVSLIILTIVLIALFNTVVFFLNQKVKSTIASRGADAALELITYPQKLDNCIDKDPCEELSSLCSSSVYCSDESVCEEPNSCVVCYTNPDNGKKIFYGLGTSRISNGTYKVQLCWIFGGYNGTYTTVITLPSNF